MAQQSIKIVSRSRGLASLKRKGMRFLQFNTDEDEKKEVRKIFDLMKAKDEDAGRSET